MSSDSQQHEEHPDPLIASLESAARSWEHTTHVATRLVIEQPGLKVGQAEGHTAWADEPERLGGGDRWPTPLKYLAMATGW